MTLRHEFELAGPAELDVSMASGQLVIEAGAPGRLVVEIDGRDDEWEVVQVGSTIAVRPVRRRRLRSARISVRLPASSRCSVAAASADVRAHGMLGAVRAKTSSGDVIVGDVAELDVSTSSGDVRAGVVDGDARVSAVSGDVRLDRVAGRLDATSTAGDILIDRVGGDVQVSTVAGDVRISRFDGSDLGVKTVAGDVALGLPSGIRVAPDISTFAGEVGMPSPADGGASSEPRRRVTVACKTVSGDITIHRSDD